MNRNEFERLAWSLCGISVFRNILETEPIKALLDYLTAHDTGEKCRAYGKFVHSLDHYDSSLSVFLEEAVLCDENEYVIRMAKGGSAPEVLVQNAEAELELFSHLTQITCKELASMIGDQIRLPVFDNTPTDMCERYRERLREIDRYGYGIFASSTMFRVTDAGITAVENPDDITSDHFVGYGDERAKIFENTARLAEGRGASNALLYGDAGTGKSSTVKASVNEYASRGVRLIELRRDQLLELPRVMGRIADNPLKFVIFIDDLSFNNNDDSFSMLKAALEGTSSKKVDNAVIYATSNRRHIVKETFVDRDGDDIHRNDTVQELMSLSDRFGLSVYFAKPAKQTYLEIVRSLAKRAGVGQDIDLDTEAEAFALQKGGRSPRAAEQFVRSLTK